MSTELMSTERMTRTLLALVSVVVVACATVAPDRTVKRAEGVDLEPYAGMVLLYGYEGPTSPDDECQTVGQVEAREVAGGEVPAEALRELTRSIGGNGVADIALDPTSREGAHWYVGRAVRCP